METLEGDATVLVAHVADQGAVRQEGKMHGREAQQCVQDIVVGCTDLNDSRTKSAACSPPSGMLVSWPYLGICLVQRVKPSAPISFMWWLMAAT